MSRLEFGSTNKHNRSNEVLSGCGAASKHADKTPSEKVTIGQNLRRQQINGLCVKYFSHETGAAMAFGPGKYDELCTTA
jgi:hypothetical protein